MADYTNYTNKEMQAVTIAKEIKDGQIELLETGLLKAHPSQRMSMLQMQCSLWKGLMDLVQSIEGS